MWPKVAALAAAIGPNPKQTTMSKRALDIQLRRLDAALVKQEESLVQLKARNRERETQFEKNIVSLRTKIEEVRAAANEYKDTIERESKRKERDLLREIERLKKLSADRPAQQENLEGLEKAKTLAIFDSILFGIENWSADGQTAPDITMVSQSVLFPTVYERVMKGNEDYFVEKVPPVAALEDCSSVAVNLLSIFVTVSVAPSE